MNKISVFDNRFQNMLFIINLFDCVRQMCVLKELKNPIVWNIAKTRYLLSDIVIENFSGKSLRIVIKKRI